MSDFCAIYPEGDILLPDENPALAEDESHAVAGKPSLVVFPRNHQQVVDTVILANREGYALVPSGGRSGLSGGACAGNGEIVVSFSRMNRIIEMDAVNGLVTVEPGVTLSALQQHVAAHGWFFPVDFASRDSAQIGGAVATNAGGIRVLRYGMMRQWVAGCCAVTGAGETLDINRDLIKDNGGYSLKDLLVGSEGTLAIFTRITLRLTRPMPAQRTLLAGLDSINELLALYSACRSAVPLSTAEFFCSSSQLAVESVYGVHSPLASKHSFYLLVEHDAGCDGEEALAAVLLQHDVVMAHTLQQSAQLWRMRELISSALNRQKPFKGDIACKLTVMDDLRSDLGERLRALHPGLGLAWFGHIGDGNLHLNILKPEEMAEDAFLGMYEEFRAALFDVIRHYQGAACSEHGVGILKKALLPGCRSPSEMSLYRQIRRLFDPGQVLNPGKLLE